MRYVVRNGSMAGPGSAGAPVGQRAKDQRYPRRRKHCRRQNRKEVEGVFDRPDRPPGPGSRVRPAEGGNNRGETK